MKTLLPVFPTPHLAALRFPSARLLPRRVANPPAFFQIALLAAAVSLPIASSAAPPPGRLLASMCAQCHGTNGQAVAGFESVSGKNANEMFKSLLEMKNRRAENIMDLQVRAFTDSQLRLIAEYLAVQPAGADEAIEN